MLIPKHLTFSLYLYKWTNYGLKRSLIGRHFETNRRIIMSSSEDHPGVTCDFGTESQKNRSSSLGEKPRTAYGVRRTADGRIFFYSIFGFYVSWNVKPQTLRGGYKKIFFGRFQRSIIENNKSKAFTDRDFFIFRFFSFFFFVILMPCYADSKTAYISPLCL